MRDRATSGNPIRAAKKARWAKTLKPAEQRLQREEGPKQHALQYDILRMRGPTMTIKDCRRSARTVKVKSRQGERAGEHEKGNEILGRGFISLF